MNFTLNFEYFFTVSTDGVFLMPPNARDGSVSPGTAKKERSTSMIAGKFPQVFQKI